MAAKLIKIYFSFFSASVKKGEVDTKLMKALLTGVNRAFPYAVLEPEELDKQMETVHKLVHLVSFNISIQALTLLYQVSLWGGLSDKLAIPSLGPTKSLD